LNNLLDGNSCTNLFVCYEKTFQLSKVLNYYLIIYTYFSYSKARSTEIDDVKNWVT